ncbi:hypothetical protein ACFFMN_25555 [Planobispora siamensis]|uniref:hypothetical protein n=1 Tax=Planobispora siamensis TaxID=936338 RepID=UPI00194DFB66|nr:hypothetical protein [Planobispora siamensis]
MTSPYARKGQPYSLRGAHPSEIVATPTRRTAAVDPQPTTRPGGRVRLCASRSVRITAVTIPGQLIRMYAQP